MPSPLTPHIVELPSISKSVGTGWLRPMSDPRDYTVDHPEMREILQKLAANVNIVNPQAVAAAPPMVDLRPWCSPIEDQRRLGSCTANAAVGVVEYFERRSFGRYMDGSRLFVYKNSRNLMGVTGDTGAFLRTAMGALTLCGVPDEYYWPYTDGSPDFDRDPYPFVYSIADNYEAIQYFSHDPIVAAVRPADVLDSVKRFLTFGVPAMFGFSGYPSFEKNGKNNLPGSIPMPSDEEIRNANPWGHAIVAVGYDDNLAIENSESGQITNGALLIRNSWGTVWGEAGYGWMPYAYVLHPSRIAQDFWSLLSMKWVDSAQFYR